MATLKSNTYRVNFFFSNDLHVPTQPDHRGQGSNPFLKAYQLYRSAVLGHEVEDVHEAAQRSAVEIGDAIEIDDQVAGPGIDECRHGVEKRV